MNRPARRAVGIALAPAAMPRASAAGLMERLGERLGEDPPVRIDLPATWAPGALIEMAAARGLHAVAVVTPPDDRGGRELRRAPPPSLPTRVIFLPEDVGQAGIVDKSVREIVGWVRAVERRPPAGPQHLRPRVSLAGAPLSRRQLWPALGAVHYDVVPAVEAGRCVGWARCALCLPVCPRRALENRDGRAAIDRCRCDACGACVRACPVDAIRLPGGTKEEIDACLDGMLRGVEGDPDTGVVAFTCARWGGWLPAPYLECSLPGGALASAWAILRALSLGAAGVVVVTGDCACRPPHDAARWQREVRVARSILEGLGVAPERVQAMDPSPLGLADFWRALARMSPPPWRRARLDGGWPASLGDLVTRMAGTADRERSAVSVAGDVPFAFVEVDAVRCSLCGLCALCPTGAIALQEDTERAGLTFHYGTCTACGLCRDACPEKAIRLTPLLAGARLREGRRELVASAVARCADCGTTLGPRRRLDAVGRRLSRHGAAPGALEDVTRRCSGCRLFAAPAGIADVRRA